MFRHVAAVAVGAGLLAGAASSPAQAQGVTVAVQQALSFGRLTPGVAQPISAGDAVNRGAVTVQGLGQFTVQLQLPTTLAGPRGATLPVVFGASDGVVETKNRSVPFDPRVGTTVKLTNGQPSATIGIGGTAQPAASQGAGSYTGSIVVMVVAQ